MHGCIDKIDDLSKIDLLKLAGDTQLWGSAAPNARVAYLQGEKEQFRNMVHEVGFRNLGRVLDVDCGFGRLSVFLAEFNDCVCGIDQNSGVVELARRLAAFLEFSNCEFEVAKSDNVPHPDQSLDGVWCYATLNYLPRGTTFAEVRRLLRPGGRFMIGKYNSIGMMVNKYLRDFDKEGRDARLTKWASRAFKQGTDFEGGANWCTLSEMGALAEKHGFVVADDFEPRVTKSTPLGEPPEELVGDISEEEYELFSDVSALIDRLENDDEFVASLVPRRHKVVDAIPGDIDVVFIRP